MLMQIQTGEHQSEGEVNQAVAAELNLVSPNVGEA